MDSRCTALALSFMVSITSSKTETCKHTNCQTITPSTRTYNLWKTRFNKVLTFRSKFHTTPVIYLGHHGRFFCLATRQQKVEKRSEKSVDFKEIFKQGTAEIDERFKGRWLKGIPNLSEECKATTLSSVVGEEIDIAGETFQVNKTETFEEVAELLTPKFLPGDFPLDITSSGISRILLRQEFIERWNGQIRSLGNQKVVRYPKWIILSAASGLGKSIDLYLAAVFARYCKIPVQYFGNTSAILRDPQDDSFVALRFLKMLLFMNADILDNIKEYFVPSSPQYYLLEGLPLKKVIYFALVKRDLYLCKDIRDTMMRLSPGNLLILDEHNALWRELEPPSTSWPPFFRLYSNIQFMSMNSCGVLIAGSQHHMFEQRLPSGYRDCVRYLEPLSLEEYNIWIALQDYPVILKIYAADVLEVTGAVPRMIAIMVSLAKDYTSEDFGPLKTQFTTKIYPEMESKHDEYVESLPSDMARNRFDKMLYKLFMDREVPNINIANGSYRDRGLLIVKDDMYLQFYNSVARDVLLSSFIDRFGSGKYMEDLIKRFRQSKSDRGLLFEELFFLWFIDGRKEVMLLSDTNPNKNLKLSSRNWVRLDKERFDPAISKFTHSCWILLSEQYPRFDYIYVDMDTPKWHVYFIQVSVSSFYQHNRGSAAIENALVSSIVPEEKQESHALLDTIATTNQVEVEQPSASQSRKGRKGKRKEEKGHGNKSQSGKSQLASLLKRILDEEFTVVLDKDTNSRIIDFQLLDTHGVDCREHVSIVYVTPLPYEKAKGVSSVPKYVEFLCREGFPENFQIFLSTDD